jgi:hypothetical protein
LPDGINRPIERFKSLLIENWWHQSWRNKMKYRLFFLVLLLSCSLYAQERIKCQASVNGLKIKTVYITGSQFNGVAWAYKHLSEETCLTPVLDPSKADAILEIVPNGAAPAENNESSDPFSISCTSRGGSSTCLDSSGNELDIICDRNGNCTSYFGPSPAIVLLHALNVWVSNMWYQAEVRLYTPDYKILWKSENQKGHWPDQWPDKVRYGTDSPPCKIPASGSFDRHKYKNYRNWGTIKCGIDFDPLVSIDIKANARIAQKQESVDQKQSEADEMKRNAQDAAAKQQSSTP